MIWDLYVIFFFNAYRRWPMQFVPSNIQFYFLIFYFLVMILYIDSYLLLNNITWLYSINLSYRCMSPDMRLYWYDWTIVIVLLHDKYDLFIILTYFLFILALLHIIYSTLHLALSMHHQMHLYLWLVIFCNRAFTKFKYKYNKYFYILFKFIQNNYYIN